MNNILPDAQGILFLADFPNEATEADLIQFFEGYKVLFCRETFSK